MEQAGSQHEWSKRWKATPRGIDGRVRLIGQGKAYGSSGHGQLPQHRTHWWLVMYVMSWQVDCAKVGSAVGDECSIRQQERYVRVQMERVGRFWGNCKCTPWCETRSMRVLENATEIALVYCIGSEGDKANFSFAVRRGERLRGVQEEGPGGGRMLVIASARAGALEIRSSIRC